MAVGPLRGVAKEAEDPRGLFAEAFIDEVVGPAA
jgi:hypothetical protein